MVIVGGGFSGLTLGYLFSQQGFQVTVIEKEKQVGGLAGAFEVEPGVWLEKFYHHWFSNDTDALELIKELGGESNLIQVNSNTGFYYAKSIYKISSPIDLLKFKALSFPARIRLGLFTLMCRRIKDYEPLENQTALEWVSRVCGQEVTTKIWEPLLKGKFGKHYREISAVWLWNKVKLRGSSRDRSHRELLYYYRGGFKAVADLLIDKIVSFGGKIITNDEVIKVQCEGRKAKGVVLSSGSMVECEALFLTPPIPVIQRLLPDTFEEKSNWTISYLGNRCLILALSRKLSDTYWLNISDPTFPFVGVIEHTNLDNPQNYGGKRIAYLSRYMPVEDPLFSIPTDEYARYCFEYVKRIFPNFDPSWVEKVYDWREEYAQPVVTSSYRSKIPPFHLNESNIFLCTMAQIYPEDRGTNYAISYAKKVSKIFQSWLSKNQ